MLVLPVNAGHQNIEIYMTVNKPLLLVISMSGAENVQLIPHSEGRNAPKIVRKILNIKLNLRIFSKIYRERKTTYMCSPKTTHVSSLEFYCFSFFYNHLLGDHYGNQVNSIF